MTSAKESEKIRLCFSFFSSFLSVSSSSLFSLRAEANSMSTCRESANARPLTWAKKVTIIVFVASLSVGETGDRRQMEEGDAKEAGSCVVSFAELANQRSLFDVEEMPLFERRRQNALFVLTSFETHYLRHLDRFRAAIMQPLAAEKILSREDYALLFGGIDELISLHRGFWQHLDAQQSACVTIDSLQSADNFLGKLVLYNDYAVEHGRRLARLAELEASQPLFVAFVANSLTRLSREEKDIFAYLSPPNKSAWDDSIDGRRTKLDSYLSLPFCHMVSYPPVFRCILKYTPEAHADHDILSGMLPAIEKVADQCRKTFYKYCEDDSD